MDQVEQQRHTMFCRQCNQHGQCDRFRPMNPVIRRATTALPWLTTSAQLITMHCRCGAGLCEVKVLSGASRYPNRRYFCCPAKRERHCGYFKLCDEPKREVPVEIEIDPFEQIYAQEHEDSSASP